MSFQDGNVFEYLRRTAENFEPDRRKLITRRHYENLAESQATIAELTKALRDLAHESEIVLATAKGLEHENSIGGIGPLPRAYAILAKREAK